MEKDPNSDVLSSPIYPNNLNTQPFKSDSVYPDADNFIRKASNDTRNVLLADISKRSGWKSLSSLEKSLSVALGLVSVLAIALMVALIIVGVELNKDDYVPPEKLVAPTLYPPWVTTILTTSTPCNGDGEITTRVRPTWPPSTTELFPTEPETCETNQCFEIKQSMDINADPCQDFYKYACGGWVLGNTASPEHPVIDQFIKIHESFMHEAKLILEKDSSQELELDSLNIAKEFYLTCLNDTESPGESDVLRNLIDDIFTGFDKTDLIPVLSNIRGQLDGSYLFSFKVDIHFENNLENSIHLGYPDLEIAKQVFHGPNNATDRIDAYKEFMMDLWTNVFPEDYDRRDEIVESLFEFEQGLLKIRYMNNSEEFLRKVEIVHFNGHNAEDFGALLAFANQTITLTSESCSESELCTLEKEFDIIILDKLYYSMLLNILNIVNVNTTVNYLKWRIILDYSKHSSEMLRISFDITKLSVLKQPTARWKMCLEKSLELFGPPIVAAYIEDKIDNPTEFKQQVFELADYVKQTLMESTQEAAWIESNSTREYIHKKLEDLQIFAVYPLSLTDKNINLALDFYSEINVSNFSSHFQNVLDLTAWKSYSELKLIWKAANETLMRKELQIQTSSEISYSHLNNYLYLPTAALQLPIYSDEHNDSLAFKYGAMGTLIGRQLVKALESTMIAYHNGAPKVMWDEVSTKNFKKSSNCIDKHYNNYNVSQFDTSLFDEKRMKMNTLDARGFKFALKSYMSSKALLDDWKIQGLNFSSEQLFFIGFAQNWCASYTEEIFQDMMEGSTTPVPYRVNFLLNGFSEFTDVWDCPKPSIQMDMCEI